MADRKTPGPAPDDDPAPPGGAPDEAIDDSIDDAIERLLDDELEGPAERGLLLELSRRGAAAPWREIALGFLERRAFTRACRGDSAGAAAAGGPATRPAGAAAARAARLFALAAALAFALGLGFSLGRAAPSTSPPIAASIAAPAPLPPPAAGATPLPQAATLPVPVVDLSRLDDGGAAALLPGGAVLSEAARGELARQGFRVQESRRLVPVRLEDGRRVLVPLESYELEYAGALVFQ